MTRSRVLNLKPSAEMFEQRKKFKTIFQHIIKALLKSKIIYSFELIYRHGLVSGITSLRMFLPRRAESRLLAGLAKPFVLKKCFCFYQEMYFNFILARHINFRKM